MPAVRHGRRRRRGDVGRTATVADALNEFKRTPFLAKKPLAVSESQDVVVGKKGTDHDKEVSRVGRRALTNDNTRIVRRNEGLERYYYADGMRWGYYPDLDERLSFGNFMDAAVVWEFYGCVFQKRKMQYESIHGVEFASMDVWYSAAEV